MTKRVAIVQSNYIPWKGYFDLVRAVDEFILLDSVQYTRRDWRNRNKIKTSQGTAWLTIPVRCKGLYLQRICDTEIEGTDWAKRHWASLCLHYRRAPYFAEYREQFESLYMGDQSRLLSEVNRKFLNTVCETLGIVTTITNDSEYQSTTGKNERLLELCLQSGATEYLSGPAAKGYLDEELFQKHGIRVLFADYSNYREYVQLFPPFDHAVTVLDLLFNTGPLAKSYMKNVTITMVADDSKMNAA